MPFIYALVDPVEPQHIRYIGISTKSHLRPFTHEGEARRASPGSKFDTCAHRWINKIKEEGRMFIVLTLIEFPDTTSRKEMFRAEKNAIRCAARAGHKILNYHERWAVAEFEGKHKALCDPPGFDLDVIQVSERIPQLAESPTPREKLIQRISVLPSRKTDKGKYQYEVNPGQWVSRARVYQMRRFGYRGKTGRPRKWKL